MWRVLTLVVVLLAAGCARAGWLSSGASSVNVVDALTVAEEARARMAGDASNAAVTASATGLLWVAQGAHTNRSDNPHGVTAAQAGALASNGIARGAAMLWAADGMSWATMTGGVLVVSRVESVIDTGLASTQMIVTASSGFDSNNSVPPVGHVFYWNVRPALNEPVYILDGQPWAEYGIWFCAYVEAPYADYRLFDSTHQPSSNGHPTPEGTYTGNGGNWSVTLAFYLAYTNHTIVTNTYTVAIQGGGQ